MATAGTLTNFKPLPYFDPRTISGCQLWLDAADVNGNGTSVANGASIATWVDKSGNGRNFTQATSGNRPVYGSFLSYPGISFTGANNTNLSNSYIQTGSGGRNTFIVFYDVNTSANQYGNPVLFYMANTNQSALGDWRAAYDGLNDYLGTDSYGGAYLYRTNPAVTSMRTSRCIGMWGIQSGAAFNTGYVYGNGTQFTTLVNSFVATSPLNVTNTGTTSVGGGQTGYVTAVISEVIYYSTDLSTADRQKIEGYLAWKWGLQRNLPSNHPYAQIQPNSFQLTAPVKSKISRFFPTQISGCQLWLDAADTTTISLSGSSVTQWRDKSGNSNHAAQATLANAPTLSGFNISFNGSQWLTTPITSAPTIESFFIVLNTTKNDTIDIFAGTSSGYREVIIYLTNIYIGKWGTAPTGLNGGVIATNTRLQFNYQYSQTNLSFSVNGTQTGSGTPPFTYTGTNTSFIGSSSYSPNNFVGTINEILYYNSYLTTAQRQQVEGYLAWKWGLQSSLPSTHPYAKFPPPS